MPHIPVLLKETMVYVGAESGVKFIDATAGGGGHSKAIVKINPRAQVLALDVDAESLNRLSQELSEEGLSGRIKLVRSNYKQAPQAAAENGFEKVSGIILDLGFSSLQMDDPQRGLSFQAQGPLDMRFDRTQVLDAAQVINNYPEPQLAEIFKKYGEESYAKKIAKEISIQRKIDPFVNTSQVFDVIQRALPKPIKHKAADAARRIFQAVRIEVNRELENLQQALPEMVKLLEPGGRLVVISFHSLEDRIVKNFFSEMARGCVCPPDFPQCACGKNPVMKILTKKPVTAQETELSKNPRSKPAKLRAAAKI
jgi:16S rRNA (cytosine1402-N4)-methyltransferase